ncbi:MAG TPA: 4-alpha-glucanotransferase, partial [Bacteroidales bacterium]|nr:4-alpha-glucanotransferase [Bacteroidales bacterium]
MKFKRSSGILLHISSLPGKYGIGTFGTEAYEFVDFLISSRQRIWQLLPLGHTGYGDSPYQCYSAFAGNP